MDETSRPKGDRLRADTKALLKKIVAALDDKKAEDIKVIHIGDVSSLCDVFVICSGTSTRHTSTLIDHVAEATSEIGVKPYGSEGKETGWALLDYSDIVVHIFQRDTREYYDLERLWMDAPNISLQELDLPLAS